ncbi:MAG TPA: hypothetical protein VNA69_13660 [Thermoanaerobaculia bacterium]|nr:hypothetical protein [Thermoanaerobaculia bacterium]
MSTIPLGVLKRRADSVLEEVFRSLFEDIDLGKVRREVEDLRAGAPDFSPSRHSRTLARRTAIRCAAAGAVTGLPLGLAAIGTLGADLAYLVFQQFRMILGIAVIYGHDLSNRERFNEALSCLAYATGVGAGKQGLAMLGTRLMRDRVTKLVPFVGVVSGGALNYASVYAVARNAIRYYESRVDDELAEEIWADGDREHA